MTVEQDEHIVQVRLERDPDNPSREVLVGIADDELEISSQAVAAVISSRRTFSYIVDRVAENRMRAVDPSFRRMLSKPPTEELLAQKGVVRDELARLVGLSAVSGS